MQHDEVLKNCTDYVESANGMDDVKQWAGRTTTAEEDGK